MGHEANYILRRGGRTQIFHSSWGGLSLTQDIFWGPDETTRFIRSLQPADALLDPDSCRGAALVDWDARRLTWFENGHLDHDPVERQIYAQAAATDLAGLGDPLCRRGNPHHRRRAGSRPRGGLRRGQRVG